MKAPSTFFRSVVVFVACVLALPGAASAQEAATSAAPAPVAAPAPTAAAPVVPVIAPPPIDVDVNSVLRACREARRVDAIAWGMTGAFTAAGVTTLAVGASFDQGESTPSGIRYMQGIGTGLLLAAIGSPIARGVFDSGHPLYGTCAAVERNHAAGNDRADDLYAADRVLRITGTRPGPVLLILLASGTGVVTALSVATIAINTDLTRKLAMGAAGVEAALLAAWVVIPPTPRLNAAADYVDRAEGRRSARVQWIVGPGPGGTAGLSIGGVF